MGRRIIQISAALSQDRVEGSTHALAALCSDGSVWVFDMLSYVDKGVWQRVPAIPQDPPQGEVLPGGYVLQTPAAGADAVSAPPAPPAPPAPADPVRAFEAALWPFGPDDDGAPDASRDGAQRGEV